MEVYIVTEGEYSSYHIEAVFSDKTKADEYAALCGGGVEEWNFDDRWTKDQGQYRFSFGLDGSILGESYKPNTDPVPDDLKVDAHSGRWDGPDSPISIRVRVNRGNRDLAVKIASERYTRIRNSMDEAIRLVDRTPVDRAHFRDTLYVTVAEILCGVRPMPKPPMCGFDEMTLRALGQTVTA